MNKFETLKLKQSASNNLDYQNGKRKSLEMN